MGLHQPQRKHQLWRIVHECCQSVFALTGLMALKGGIVSYVFLFKMVPCGLCIKHGLKIVL